MELLLAILLGFGLGVFALSPFVPGLRPIVRAVVGVAWPPVGGGPAAAVMGAALEGADRGGARRARGGADSEPPGAAETITIPFPEQYRARGAALDEDREA